MNGPEFEKKFFAVQAQNDQLMKMLHEGAKMMDSLSRDFSDILRILSAHRDTVQMMFREERADAVCKLSYIMGCNEYLWSKMDQAVANGWLNKKE